MFEKSFKDEIIPRVLGADDLVGRISRIRLIDFYGTPASSITVLLRVRGAATASCDSSDFADFIAKKQYPNFALKRRTLLCDWEINFSCAGRV